MEYNDGSVESVVSDQEWKVAQAPLHFPVSTAERITTRARNSPDGTVPVSKQRAGSRLSEWADASGILTSQMQPPVQVIDVYHTVKVTEPTPGIHVYDLGQNFRAGRRSRCAARRARKCA